MFIIFLRFAAHREQASAFLTGHKAWLEQGVADGVFSLVGSIKPPDGGAILAHGLTLAELERRVSLDPFVEHQVVTAQIIEVAPSQVDDRLRFLLEGA